MSPWQNQKSLRTTQHVAGDVVNKLIKDKILAKRINVHTEHIEDLLLRAEMASEMGEGSQEGT